MKIQAVQGYQNNTNFTALKPKNVIPESVIKRYDLNMETMIGYNGEKNLPPLPKNLKKSIKDFFNKLEIDWNTHVEKIK